MHFIKHKTSLYNLDLVGKIHESRGNLSIDFYYRDNIYHLTFDSFGEYDKFLIELYDILCQSKPANKVLSTKEKLKIADVEEY